MAEKITVRVNDKLANRGAGFRDPDQKVNPGSIGKKPRDVVKTGFVVSRIGSGELIEVKAAKQEKPKEPEKSGK